MQRIMVISCGGAGKSTLSKRLHDILGLPIFHLDQIYWKSGWVESEKEQWVAASEKLTDLSKWIIDGNYGSTMDMRIKRADTIIYLDYSTFKCLYRITKRLWKYKGTSRPDMTEGCPERFDLEFYHYVLTYNMTRRKNILTKLAAVKDDKKVYVLRNDREVKDFLGEIQIGLT